MSEIQVREHIIVIREHPEVFSPSITTRVLLDYISISSTESVCDMGAGTGVLGIMAAKMGAKKVTLIEKHPIALEIIQKNLIDNQVENCTVIHSDMFENDPGKYDVILVNLPQLPIALKHEGSIKPKDNGGGERGNTLVLKFLNEAKDHLNENGRIFIPIFGVSSRQTTMKTIDRFYKSTILKKQKIRVNSDPVIQLNLEHIYQLQQSGEAELFTDENGEYLEVSIFELKKNVITGSCSTVKL